MKAATTNVTSRRINSRTRAILRATLITAEGNRSVRIRNFSPGGAEIVADLPLPSEGDVVLMKGRMFAAATIVWAKGPNGGLRFYSDQAPELAN